MIQELIEGISKLTTKSIDVTEDIECLQFNIVNSFLIGKEGAQDWVLVDTGLSHSYDYIIKRAKKRFGEHPPKAIILTHAHFDHVGSLLELANYWTVPVYAHQEEIPYITGEADYPVADPNVDEGWVAKVSPYFPHESINIGYQANPLPFDGTVPGMPGWKWIHTSGHTPGHVSLFRASDGVLIVGDAFTTTKQESLTAVLTQKEDVKGPPAYLTTNWKQAKDSAEVLKKLNPKVVIPSHGKILEGEELTQHLELLVDHFDQQAVPSQGRFV